MRGGHGVDRARAARVSRMPAAHPEGYIEAFANLYRDAAEIIRAHRTGAAGRSGARGLVPDVADGARGVKFVAAAVASQRRRRGVDAGGDRGHVMPNSGETDRAGRPLARLRR